MIRDASFEICLFEFFWVDFDAETMILGANPPPTAASKWIILDKNVFV